jgi:ribulose-phosphate 3-epimerase
MEIIPAILPKNFKEIEDKIELIRGISDFVQIDICDGKFVRSTTWPYWKQDENFEKILREEMGMPSWEDIDYEFDLMIDNPTEDDARKWLSAGAERVVLHLESSNDLNPIISILSGLVEIGIAIDLKTNVDEIEKYEDKIQFIQCMGINKVGFQGQKFDQDTINKVKEIKFKYPNLKIQIDGGVSLENASLLKDAGADRLVVGSALFESDNIVHSFEELRNI